MAECDRQFSRFPEKTLMNWGRSEIQVEGLPTPLPGLFKLLDLLCILARILYNLTATCDDPYQNQRIQGRKLIRCPDF